jgi:hypothetical protein
MAITDHQTFEHYAVIASEAAKPGRPLMVLPGIEITSPEGCHLIAIFPPTFGENEQHQFYGRLEMPVVGNTREPARKPLSDILREVNALGGVIVIPHPKSEKFGLLDSSRKIGIKTEWLESGLIRLIQCANHVVQYVERDGNENFVNRYILASVPKHQIPSTRYCLAPFNRSDAHKAAEIPDGCSWFRMQIPCIEGLKQVACEPRTRISRQQPSAAVHDCVMALRVAGGYCDGQTFCFSDSLHCIVGQNYSGKSAILDFIRFALVDEDHHGEESRLRLLDRLNGILGPGGVVEAFVRQGGQHYVVTRRFEPVTDTSRAEPVVTQCVSKSCIYRFDETHDDLVVEGNVGFPIEVYEQGRISRLRDDVGRQLGMIDEFAGLRDELLQRKEISAQIRACADRLHPLYSERESIQSQTMQLSQLETELEQKMGFLPDNEEQLRWAEASSIVARIEEAVRGLQTGVASIPEGPLVEAGNADAITLLFGQTSPVADEATAAEGPLLTQWAGALKKAVDAINDAKTIIRQAVATLQSETTGLRERWSTALKQYEGALRRELAKGQVQSAQELITKIGELRESIRDIKEVKLPKLQKINTSIQSEECIYQTLLNDLRTLDQRITATRLAKAAELTESLNGKIKVELAPQADRQEYSRLLDDLYESISTRDRKIQNKAAQLRAVVENVAPTELAAAIKQSGRFSKDGETVTLMSRCGITENTQSVLCQLGSDVRRLAKLQTTALNDVPKILVRRHGENEYANLTHGLSQGEQSAAILTMALQTRRSPLIIDQPEDELGYNYVVHLVVPKILEAKAKRQLLVVTLHANVPVLGDADFVTKMENNPDPTLGRRCIVRAAGCFESRDITNALLELEGGREAFEFRQYRYSLPN